MGAPKSFTLDEGTDRQLAGWRVGEGPRVLALHGGPGLSFSYLDSMITDIGSGFEVATYQQRGLPPSTTSCPLHVGQEVGDVCRVLDHLGWDDAWLVGHSWGGHLLLHVAVTHGDRLRGGLAVDPLGGVGDGGMAAFGVELHRRATEETRGRLEEIEERLASGGPDDGTMREHLALLWPGYFAVPSAAPPMPDIGMSAAAYSAVFVSIEKELPRLEASLGTIRVPIGFLAGGGSPLPADISTKRTAACIEGSFVEVVDGAGHFPWYESPGCVRRALERLVGS